MLISRDNKKIKVEYEIIKKADRIPALIDVSQEMLYIYCTLSSASSDYEAERYG